LRERTERKSEMKVTVDSTYYRNAWGVSPKGYGSWIFYRRSRGLGGGGAWLPIRSADGGLMNYGEAKKLAVESAKAHGISEIFVGASSHLWL